MDMVRRDWTDVVAEQEYTVPKLEFYECPACSEKVFDTRAMQRIEAVCPAFRYSRRRTDRT